MRVMVLVKASDDSEKGILPTTEMFEAMGKYNEELVNSLVMHRCSRHCPTLQSPGPGCQLSCFDSCPITSSLAL
jgi:hypothetical protein